MEVNVGSQGQVQIHTGKEYYFVDSRYSYPGAEIGWNALSGTETGNESGWSPRANKIPEGIVEVEARGTFYSLHRRVTPAKGRIVFEDTLTNLRKAPIGFIVEHNLTGPTPFKEVCAPGGAENPTIFLAGETHSLGVLVEDNISRLRFEPSMSPPANQAGFRIVGLALDVGKSCTMRWTVYLIKKGGDYFGFVNQVRRDWRTNFTIEGPFSFFDSDSPLLDNPHQLKAYLQRKRLGVVALTPFTDYDPGSFERVWTRDEYKVRMQKATSVFRKVDPTIKCVGCVETDWVTIYPDRIKGGEKLPVAQRVDGNFALTPEQTKIIDEANLPWKDSVKRDPEGNLKLELYIRGGKPQTALSVYPAVGNYQHEFLLGQVKFLLDDVGMDGFYIDEFRAWGGRLSTTTGWDGCSAEIDPRSGEIKRCYVDCALAGIGARVNLCEYALKRGKIVIANTYATAKEEQSLPVNRFDETQGAFNPFAVADGVEPPAVAHLFRGNLASPIGLGILGVSGKQDIAIRIMKAVTTYLRHGALYYHYAIEDIPETGEGSGAYGPINHMFPITPVELHKGRIEGRERIITCVSGHFLWKNKAKPRVLLFDDTGREKAGRFSITQATRGWKVVINLRDWAEVAVVEK